MAKNGGVLDLDAYESKLNAQEWTGPVVKFRGEEFQFVPDIGVPDLIELEEGKGSSISFLCDLVVEEQRDAFRDTLMDRENPVSALVLRKLSEEITERYANRPT